MHEQWNRNPCHFSGSKTSDCHTRLQACLCDRSNTWLILDAIEFKAEQPGRLVMREGLFLGAAFVGWFVSLEWFGMPVSLPLLCQGSQPSGLVRIQP